MNLVLIGSKSPRLFQKTIDQRRFAMIHVRDNCDIPNMLHTMLQLESLNLPVSSKRSSFLAAQIAAPLRRGADKVAAQASRLLSQRFQLADGPSDAAQR